MSDLLKKVGFSGGGGGTLVAASEGSKQLQNILLVGPESIRQKYMVDLMSDAKELSKQLLNLKTTKQKKASERSIEKYFVNLGLNTALKRGYLATRDRNEDRFEDLESLSISPAPEQQSSVQKPPQITPTQVSANLPRPGPTVTTSSPPVSNQPVDRARFAQLFPEDRALIEGIGSLV